MQDIHTNSTAAVEKFLLECGPASPVEIGRACHIQENTVIKDMHFLRKRGVRIGKHRIALDKKRCYYMYWILDATGMAV